ncbi:hypothetical protein CERSUDRAFT_111952 [Gelatoporia subvermispora B]|uniref:Uncharacterized protein n=1 Tax=Ceriporiopsis subvermispora (strain B) TaxID=914234 RepID=M2RLC6_CERS8|nr:hypothetical protein CERSUDRAFT_111952 [Gelatoporia subvermispora B]
MDESVDVDSDCHLSGHVRNVIDQSGRRGAKGPDIARPSLCEGLGVCSMYLKMARLPMVLFYDLFLDDDLEPQKASGIPRDRNDSTEHVHCLSPVPHR